VNLGIFRVLRLFTILAISPYNAPGHLVFADGDKKVR
jgi:hypothetical protein